MADRIAKQETLGLKQVSLFKLLIQLARHRGQGKRERARPHWHQSEQKGFQPRKAQADFRKSNKSQGYFLQSL